MFTAAYVLPNQAEKCMLLDSGFEIKPWLVIAFDYLIECHGPTMSQTRE